MLNKDKIRQSFSLACWLKRICIAVLCTALSATGSVILSDTAKLIKINDGEKNYLIRSFTGNIPAAICSVGLPANTYEINTSETTANTTSVNIEYLFPVYITAGNTTVKHYTGTATVAEILNSAGFTVDEFDMTEPAADEIIDSTSYIDFADIDYVTGSYTEPILPETVTVTDASLKKGAERTEKGSEGLKQINFTEKFVNGVKTDTVVNSTEIIKKAVPTKKYIGSKVNSKPASAKPAASHKGKTVSTLKPDKEIKLDKNGIPVNYSKHITAKATAYTYTGNRCSTGVNPQPGYIAVNPKYIPYGTKMFIRTPDGSYIYGYAVAADTGGFVKRRPTGVDLFFATKSACINFGVRNVDIYILN